MTGTITITDQDVGDTLVVSVTGNATATYSGGALPGSVSVSTLIASAAISFAPATSNGESQAINWTYDPAAADLDWLASGETLTITYVARVNDGQGIVGSQNLVVTITGTNDSPVISLETGDAATATLSDTSAPNDLFASDTLTVRDVDLSDTVTASVVNSATDIVTSGPLGTLNNTALAGMFSLTGGSINANPSDANNLTWTFNPAAGAFDYLKNGESLAITYTVTVNDSKGGTDTQDITITINGANDVPLTSYVSSTSSSFTITASDPDDTSLKLAGNPTTLFNDQNGNPTSVVNNGSPTTFTVVEQTTQTSYRVVVEDVPGAQTKVLNADGDEVVVSLGTTGGNVLDSVSSVQAGIYYGFGGNDTITGGVNADTIYGGTGNDTINAGTGNDFIAGEIGDDTLHGGGGQDTIYGGDGVDNISWTNTTAGTGVTADGGDGNDYIDADTDDVGNDTLAGGRGDDTIYGGGGDDRIEGGEDNDTLKGEEGDDTLLGGDGNDSLEGGNGNDSLSGGSGDDTIKAGLGVDTIVSGAGADQISLDIGSSGESDYVVYEVSSVNGVQTAADSPAYGATTGYDVITGVETARDVLVFNQFVPGAGRKLDGTNGSSVTGGLNAGITSTASVLVVESSAVAAGSSLTVDIAAALNAAFDLSSLKDGEEMLFSVKAADIDGDGNTSQYWVGIFNNTVVDDANSAGEIQVVALVTQVGSGGIDWDNFRNEVPSTPLIGGTPNTSSLSYDITPTDDATVTPFSNPVTDPDKTHFPITAGNRFKGATYVSDFVPGVTQLPVPPTFLGTGDDEVHNQQFEVYYGSYDFATGIFTVTSTPSSAPSVPTSHTLILYDNDSTSNVEFIEGLVFDGFMRESSWSINNGGTANATLQFTPPAGTLYGTPGADTLTGTASAELIQGLAANDSLSGGDGVDTIAGGAGDDTLVGGLGNDVLIGGVGNDTFSYASGDGLDTFKDFGVGDVYDTDFVTTSGNYKVVSATANPLAGLSLDISSATGAGVFQFTADFADALFNTGSVLDATQMDALLKTIDSDGIVDLNATGGRFMLVMTDTSTNKSHLYQVVDTTGGDNRVGSGDVGGLTLVGNFEEMAAPWTTGYIA
ncbi:VCBS domain-containing protein [Thauera sp.]|uniref:VCBS domain-containing protein n=1 Tax=Thauera sp. TaxID=1905334 RepID=UPI00257961D4|nr:VCBS domain-containing protein [Thauera sp.]